MTASASALTTVVGSVNSTTVGEDVCQRAFGSEFAVPLKKSALQANNPIYRVCTFVKYLHGAESIAASVE